MDDPTPDADVRERIDRVIRLLERRLDEDVPLEELATEACWSMFHFHRLFRGITGETVREYVRRMRLERAAHRLVHGSDDILGIALDAGYESHEAFTRAFRRRFDVTPSRFRAERRAVQVARADAPEEPPMHVRIERRDAVRIACVRHVGPYTEVGEAWARLMKWGWTRMIFGKPDTFGLCHDDPDVTPAERIRYDACMIVDARTKSKPGAGIEIRDLPPGTWAVARHDGPYTELGRTYARLCARVTDGPIEGRMWTLGDPPSREIYLNDPRRTAPAELRTDVWMPIR